MAKRTVRATLVGLVAVLALPAFAVARPVTPDQAKSRDNMIKECRTHCQVTTTSIDQLTKRMETAKQSNDPVQMRAALDEAQKPLTDMKDHMAMCMNMMSMMHGRHGGMGGHMDGQGGHMGGMMQDKGAQSGAEAR